MELYIIMFKNLAINAFTNPNFTDVEPKKAAEGLKRALIANYDSDQKLVKSYENLEMFSVGTFNDETGVITQEAPVMLLSCKELIAQITASKIALARKESENEKAEAES